MQNLMELGELYKELRMARGLKLKDVASDNLSISQLSKFENGQSMLSADKLFVAIEGINMTLMEFGHAFNNYEDRAFFKLGDQIAQLHARQDIEGLKRLLKVLESKEDKKVYDNLNLLIVKENIHFLDRSFEIKKEEVEFLTSYLYGIDEWTEYEIFLFGNTLSLLSNSDLVFLGKEFVKRDKFYRSIPTHQTAAKLTLSNLIFVLIERREFDYVTYFLDILEDSVDYEDMLIITFLNFFKLLLTYIKSGQFEELLQIKEYIAMVRKLGNSQLAQHLEANLEPFIQVSACPRSN
ncbi:Positive transcriptional regulator, MutR family [Streptococcus sp. DD11]|uniref:helix-turn-helix domain-containing protein n=1 Tax=Streptococcus sp. DD11 TaxID=1777879 RepID=UPI0007967571|nr:Rgg/GadR/MutR family transcriptional regulator [Streptococcus sp. DD11]KXT85711.1 Positive transcriptional regulator, MutR family [Streptococcus sp. DD11]